jgi:hypothetical protein
MQERVLVLVFPVIIVLVVIMIRSSIIISIVVQMVVSVPQGRAVVTRTMLLLLLMSTIVVVLGVSRAHRRFGSAAEGERWLLERSIDCCRCRRVSQHALAVN